MSSAFLFSNPAESLDHEPVQSKEIQCCPQSESKHFSLWGSFIYWQPQQSCMDVGMEAPYTVSNNALGNSHKHGKVIQMDAGYAPGFKVGAAYSFSSTNWQLLSEYTYLRTNNSVSRNQHEGGFLYSRWIQPDLIADNASRHLKAQWELNMDLLTAEVGRRFFIGSQFEVYPHFGLGAAWFEQTYHGKFSLVTPAVHFHSRSHSNSWGVGPRIGLNTAWHIRPYLSLLANCASEILFTRYHLSVDQKATNDSTIFLDSSNQVSAMRPEVELYLGLSYTGYYGKQCRWIKLEAGYDVQFWWNQNMMRWFTDSTYVGIPEGNLAFQGLRLSASVGF